jgi:peptide/nickel transport system substrate-binding protein
MKRLFPILFLLSGSVIHAAELRFCLQADPKTFNPLLVEDEPSEVVRYLTGGVLIRFNRYSQKFEPELAASWKVSHDRRQISFQLRSGLRYSDGSPFSSRDVAHTLELLKDPALRSPAADSFRAAGGIAVIAAQSPEKVTVRFAKPVGEIERLFDDLVILSSTSPLKEKATLGPFHVSGYRPGVSLALSKNPNYWKKDETGRALPYLDTIRIDIQQNREFELLRFRRGQIHLVGGLTADQFERLSADSPGLPRDSGPSLDAEFFWFNQVPSAPVAEHKKAWFRSQNFRRAVSESVRRDDLCRVVFRGRAKPAAGPVSPANLFWYNQALKPHAYAPESAKSRLEAEGFRLEAGLLRDRHGNPVEFSLVHNSGNKEREKMAAMIQQDLARIGIRVNIVALDFPSLIERMTRSFNYEGCLLGLVNVGLDPNGQMNVWLSSASNHQWNPGQKTPATEWEAEIDRHMRAQAALSAPAKRKAHFDRVQQIVWEQEPFIYLVHKNYLSAISGAVANVQPAVLRPYLLWNAERLSIRSETAANRP